MKTTIWQEITTFFETRILNAGPNATPENIALENRPFDPAGKTLWFEARVVETSSEPFTEKTVRRSGVAVYTVAVAPGAGTARLERNVGFIRALFSPQIARLGVFGDKRLRVVVRNVETTPAFLIDGFYKKNVRVHFDAFADAREV